MPSPADAADPIRIGPRWIRCRLCGHRIRRQLGDLVATLRQAENFALSHRHPEPKNEAPRQVPAGEEQNETQEIATHEHDDFIPPKAERQAAGGELPPNSRTLAPHR